MKTWLSALFVLSFALELGACAPSPAQVKKVIQDNPDIVFDAMVSQPEKFLKAAAEASRRQQASDAARALDEQFAHPRQPTLDNQHVFAGPANAAITIVAYSDFQCPYCRRGETTMQELQKAYPGKVRIYFKHFPVSEIHPQALYAARMFEAIALQDKQKALAFKDKLFAGQEGFTTKREKFVSDTAASVGADLKRAERDAESDAVLQRILADQREGSNFGVDGTPAYLINGIRVDGAKPIEDFRVIIDRLLTTMAAAPQQSAPAGAGKPPSGT